MAYTYDGEGQRVRKLVGENLRFVYDIGGNLIAEFSGTTGVIKKEYIYGANGLVATIEPNGKLSNGTRYTTSDHLGSPRVVTNSFASVVSRHDYKPFGEEIGAGIGGRTTGMGFIVIDGIRQKFTSYERDNETGLDFAQARFYSNQQGRFTSADPLMASATAADPQSFNRYTYAMNSPITTTDPSGMLSMSMTSACGQFAENDESVNGVEGTGGAFSGGGEEKTQEIPEQGRIRSHNKLVGMFAALAAKASQNAFLLSNQSFEIATTLGTEPQKRSDSSGDANIRTPVVIPIQQPATNNGQFVRCFNGWRFSALVGDLSKRSRFRGFLEGSAKFLEFVPPIVVAADGVAAVAKAQRSGIGGSKVKTASSLNWFFRRTASPTTKGALIKFGTRATPILGGIGAFTAGYNASVAAQCGLGIIR